MSGLDLYQTQRALALMFVYAAVTGFALGGVYDLLRILRVFCGDRPRSSRQGSGSTPLAILLFVQDLLFSALTALSLILLCYYTNDGHLRAPAVVGMASGFFVYMQTVGRVTEKLASPLIRLIKRFLKAILILLYRPLLWLGTVAATLARLIWRVTVGKALFRRREKQTGKAIEALKSAGKRGFDLMADPIKTANPKKK